MRPVAGWRARTASVAISAAVALALAPPSTGTSQAAAVQTAPVAVFVPPARTTDALPHDPDDPAIWVNARNPAQSLVLATMKVAAPEGGLAVFGLDGHLRQMLTGPDRPNNVDVEYGLRIGGVPTDIAVLTERLGGRLRVYAIAPDGSRVTDISGTSLSILGGTPALEDAPMGIGLYRRPRDGAVFAIVAPKAGPRDDYLWQYRLEGDAAGRVTATLVRRFGQFSGEGEIEAVAVDDALGYVYYADEHHAIHKWRADPDAPDAGHELARFAIDGYQGDREGIGIYTRPDGTGFIISVDQLPSESVFHVYRREGEPGRPHDHTRTLLTFRVGADQTDGMEVTSAPLGPAYPAGLLVAMNSTPKNFLFIRWDDIAARLTPPR